MESDKTALNMARSRSKSPSVGPDEALLQVEGLSASYDSLQGEVEAVKDVTFRLRSSTMTGIVGESGSGKSATIRAVLGLLGPQGSVIGGTVHVQGHGEINSLAVEQRREVRRKALGFIPQNPFASLNPILRIDRQFRDVFRLVEPHIRMKDVQRRARDLLEEVGMVDGDRVLRGHAHELSGGMAQRVVIALTLAREPRVILADEPTTALDGTVQKRIMELLRGLVQSRVGSILIVTHDLGVVAQYCDDVHVMYAGRIVESGPVQEVFRQPAHPYSLGLLRSVPEDGRPLEPLSGTVPSLIGIDDGCAFRDRCAWAEDQCSHRPPSQTFDSGQISACILDERMGVDDE